jgi:hypothetical protein
MEYTKEYVERCIRQHKSHTRTRVNGDKVVSLGMGVFDLFSGDGWTNHSRFRIVRLRNNNSKQLIQLSGMTLSREYRDALVKEC